VNFNNSTRITTDNQKFPKKRIGHFSTPLKWQGMEKAAANLNGDESGNGRYSQ
jgi:hypothetical protein